MNIRKREGNMNMRVLKRTIEDYKRIMLNRPWFYSDELLETQFKIAGPMCFNIEERKFLCDSLIEAIKKEILEKMEQRKAENGVSIEDLEELLQKLKIIRKEEETI